MPSQAHDPLDDISAVEALMAAYYRGMYDGDGAALRQVFDPGAYLTGFVGERYIRSSLEEFIGRASASPTAKEAGEPYEMEVLGIRLDGPIGTAVVRDSFRGQVYIDHLSVVRQDGAWRIVAKSFVAPAP